MNNSETLIAAIVITIIFFLLSFVFFNKVLKLDRQIKEDTNKDLLPLLGNSDYGKFWFNEHVKVVSKMMEINAILKLVREEAAMLKTVSSGKELVGMEGMNELTQYFIKGSDNNKKLFAKFKDNNVDEVQDFTKKSLDYISYFFMQNALIEPVLKAINNEKGITERYKNYRKAKNRIADLELYSLALNKTIERCKKEDLEVKSMLTDNNLKADSSRESI
ncbi:MAG: hypothetical protein J6N72_05400 [Psychrobacter sp.]|nr:hypothetical protein [Psychrobacter sp.]